MPWYVGFFEWASLAFLFGLLVAPSISFATFPASSPPSPINRSTNGVYSYTWNPWAGCSASGTKSSVGEVRALTQACANANGEFGGQTGTVNPHTSTQFVEIYFENTNRQVNITSPWAACPAGYTVTGTGANYATCTANAGSLTCPSNATLSGSDCNCNANFVQQGAGAGATCQAQSSYCQDLSTTGTGKTTITTFVGYDTNGDGLADVSSGIGFGSRNANGCKAILALMDPQNCFSYDDAPTKIYCTSTFSYTGDVATGGDPGPDTPNGSNPCPTGQGLAQVNGISRCLPTGGPPTIAPAPATTQQTTGTVTNGDGSTTTTTTTTNGTTTTTQTTNCNADKTLCTTSTTSTQSGASTGQAGNSDQAQFCRDNPTAAMCKPVNDFCAQPENAGKVQCLDQGEWATAENFATQERGTGSITPVSMGGGGSCPADIPLPKGLTFTYSGFCYVADGVRPALLAVGWLLAALIVVGGFKGE